jgi:hypothetical protein
MTTIFLGVSASLARGDERVDYLTEIKPLLREKCFACHGGLEQKARLRLDTAALMKKGGKRGAAIQPGNPEKSLLIERVSTKYETERMPPEGPPLSAKQIARLRAWIAQGAPAPAQEKAESNPREHWAFRSPKRPPVPMVKNTAWLKNPLDAFIAAEHERHGLVPRAQADRAHLLRRVTIDLIGLPPTRPELKAYLSDPSTDAYERVVDRLLADPRYGERWGRHWMDVWRYSDWYGRRMVPDVWNSAPQIWRWRDWIVESLNKDHGYDRMVREMLAADEISAEDTQAAVATGFLIRNWYALNPNDWMRQTVEHTAKAFLGLTFNCAHCHDHKYDPIRQIDYFRLRAYFEPIGIRQERVAGEADPGPFQEYDYSVLRKINLLGLVRIYDKNATSPTWFYTGGDERNRVKEKGPIQPGLPVVFDAPSEIKPIDLPPRAFYPGARPTIQRTIIRDIGAALSKIENELKELVQVQKKAPSEKIVQLKIDVTEGKIKALRADLASVLARIGADQAKFTKATQGSPSLQDLDSLARKANEAERQAALRHAEVTALIGKLALAVGEAKPAKDPKRANEIAAANKELVAANAALEKARRAVKTAPSTNYTALSPIFPKTSTGRRKALAEWITGRSNPLTARVAINHMWMRHFHAPLVASVFDFGRNGSPPSHPELLDWLAVEFMESGWSMKHMHRLIVTSQAYGTASGQGKETANAVRDPENKYLWRMNAGRIEAEVVRDSLLFCAGQLDLKRGGQELENSLALTTHRRSLYYSCHPEGDGKSELGQLFDAPDAGECYRRTRTIIPQQALVLTNSDFIHGVSAAMAKSLWENLPVNERTAAAFIRAAYETILSRSPSEAELVICSEFLKDTEARKRASFLRALFNHNDFVAIR